MTGVGTLWRTVRHLKAGQVVGRLRFKLQRPKPDPRPAPPTRAPSGPWVVPARRQASLVDPTRLRLLNVEHDIDRVGWNDPSVDRLWRYNLHYFDDLNAQASAGRRIQHCALVARWVAENPPARGTGWEPYPVSIRIVNWVKWFVGGAPAEPEWLHSLAIQTRWLSRRLEVHLLGNHLFANAKALVCAGLYFDGPEAAEWLTAGLEIIDRELPEQILADGGQFERSPMYHALALEDVLDLVNIIDARAPPGSSARRLESALRAHATHMLYWLRCMSHPDGGIGLFNDAADGVAPANSELERYATDLSVTAPMPAAEGVIHLAASGYVRVARGVAVALLDVAPVGPDYLPGHAHADTLSFELSLGRRRIVVNGGTSRYGQGAQRDLERGTAAHSTVEVAGENSSEVWAGFRVGRRARPTPVTISGWDIACAHDGYHHLPGRPEHRRTWRFGSHDLTVDDTVTPDASGAIARYHLAPGLTLHSSSTGCWDISDGTRAIARVEVSIGDAQAGDSRHAPQFGSVLTTQALIVKLAAGRAVTHWSWNPDAHPVPH